MGTGQPSTQSENRIASGTATLCAIWLIFIAIAGILLHIHGVIYMLMVMLGFIVGIVYSQRKYPSWSNFMRASRSTRFGTKRYYIGSALFIFITIMISRSLEPLLQTVFIAVLMGALNGWVAGMLVWSVTLYPRRDKGVNE